MPPSVLSALAARFRGALAVLGEIAAAALLLAAVLFAGRGLLLLLALVVLVALLAGFHMLFVGATLVRHDNSPVVGGATIRLAPTEPAPGLAVPSRNKF